MFQVEFLPLSLYFELHFPLLLHRIINGKTDLQWKGFFSFSEKVKNKAYELKKMKTHISDFKKLNRIFSNAHAH